MRIEFPSDRQLELFGDAVAASGPDQSKVLASKETSHRANGWLLRLTLGEAARIIREAVKDKSYRSTSLGQLVGRYLRCFRNEYGATESTLRDYEAVLARMSLTLADKEPIDVSVDDLRDVIDLWGERSPRTRQKVTSVVRALDLGRRARPHRHLAGGPDQASARREARRAAPAGGRAPAPPHSREAPARPPRPFLPAPPRRAERRAGRDPGPRLRRATVLAARV